ncbi:hypothetical protein P0Y35_14555 [Kiritimatiellaeota bacterium B1221]|nr:hypothetical protein [Kiritimatiellaeota bacterium B1221]
MNHYINLLDKSEVEFHSTSSVSPRLKYVGIAGFVLLVGFFISQYQGYSRTAKKGEELEETWERIEEDVETAKALNNKKLRLIKAQKTLAGWAASQHDWPNVIEYFADASPVPAEDIQFTELSFDEQMRGMRAQVPSASASSFHPLKRQITITLKGVIQTDRPQRQLPNYRRNIVEGEMQPSPVKDVVLSNPVILEDADGRPTGLSEFSLRVILEDKELTP